MISPVPAIFLLPVFLISDGILKDFVYSALNEASVNTKNVFTVSGMSGKAVYQSQMVLTATRLK
jgi:hypothetical protein